jgi:glycosyltransferase involved in cell wall biosynthesis
MTKISFVLPIYNEEKNIQALYDRTIAVIKQLTFDYELIFINDYSKDKSLEMLQGLLKHNKNIKIIDFSRNF